MTRYKRPYIRRSVSEEEVTGAKPKLHEARDRDESDKWKTFISRVGHDLQRNC